MKGAELVSYDIPWLGDALVFMYKMVVNEHEAAVQAGGMHGCCFVN
jgi:hypothetical protein